MTYFDESNVTKPGLGAIDASDFVLNVMVTETREDDRPDKAWNAPKANPDGSHSSLKFLPYSIFIQASG
jgi:hypothetical protein